MDIHNYKRRLETTEKKIQNSDEFSKKNKEITKGFINDLIATNIGAAKASRYLTDVIKFNRMLGKDFDTANRDDIKRVFADLNRTDLSEETKRSFKIMVRKFYKFIRGVEGKGKYPPEVDWFTVALSNGKKKLPEELLTNEEMESIIRKCLNERDRAFVAILCESGARIGEIFNLKIKHVSFEQYGARLTLSGKTGMRKILVIGSCPYIQIWLNHHPDNENGNAYLWAKSNGEPVSYTRMTAIIKKAAERAGIKKRVNPHSFRHSRATLMASIMKEAGMKQYFGWTQASKMAAIYVHMNGQETDDAILSAHGIKKEKQEKPLMLDKTCLRCGTKNGFSYKICYNCGLPLDEEEAKKIIQADTERQKADEIMNKIVDNPEVWEMIKEKIKN